MITRDKMKYLMILAEERNVTKAAKRLFIAQPTLTTYLNHLEKELGFKIFDRTVNPIEITRAGIAYIDKMNALLAEEERLVERLQEMTSVKTELRIGMGYVHSEMWAAELISGLLKRHPFLNITIREFPEMQLLDLLKKDQLDLFLGHMSMEMIRYEYEEIGDQPLCIMIPVNLLNPYEFHPNKKKREEKSKLTERGKEAEENNFQPNSPDHLYTISPEILSNMPIIEPGSNQGMHMHLKQMMELYHLHPIRKIRTSNMITATTLLQKGFGYMYSSPSLMDMTRCKTEYPIIYCTCPKLQNFRKEYAIYKKDNPNIEMVHEAAAVMREIMNAQ